jgi:predicted nucleic acid-binding protein
VRYLLDTCVVSEFVKPRPSAKVVAWLAERPEVATHLSVLTLGEIEKGITRLPSSRRRRELAQWLEQELRPRFRGRILQVGEEIAVLWGRLHGEAELRGEPLPVVDCLIAATALTHDLTVVTRNISDIARAGARVDDPWSAAG